MAQAVQPAVSRVVSTLVDARENSAVARTSPRMATQQAGQPAPRSVRSGISLRWISGELPCTIGRRGPINSSVLYKEEVLRGVRLAVGAVTALLLCVAVYRALVVPVSDPPDPPALAAEPDDPHPVSTPVVPPPPPLPAVREPGPTKPASRKARPEPIRAASTRPGGPVPVIVGNFSDETPASVSTATIAETAPLLETADSSGDGAPSESAAGPEGPVIVTPPEPPPRGNRGMRWIKAVGRVLHLGAHKEAAPDALR